MEIPLFLKRFIHFFDRNSFEELPGNKELPGKSFNDHLKENLNYARAHQDQLPSGKLIGHADMWFNLQGDPKFTLQLPEKVIWQILHAASSKKDKEGIIHFGSEFGYAHLNPQELTLLFRVLNSFYLAQKQMNQQDKTNPIIFHAHVFNIYDHILRLCLDNPQEGKAVLNHLILQNDKNLAPIIKEIKKVLHVEDDSFKPIFHHLVSAVQGKALASLENAKIVPNPSMVQEKKRRPLKVLKLALESYRNQVGGLGAVLKASGAAHRQLGLEKVRGLHPLYTHDKINLDLKFKGQLEHQFDGKIVKSTIYKDNATGDYLVQPDPRFTKLFDIGRVEDLYGQFKSSARTDRYLYMASAAALFAGTYSGKTGDKSIDVIQSDAWHVGGPATALMASSIDHLREEAGLQSIKKVYLTHMLVGDPAEQGEMSASSLKGIGGAPSSSKINYAKEGLIHSDKNIFVSKGVAHDAIDPSPEMNKNLREATLAKEGPSKVIGITNGIDTSMFDIANTKQYGDYALKRTFMNTDRGRIETTDYLGNQEKIKKDLFDTGIIADPEKPLFLYVGRYSSEKGIDMLPAMVEEIKKQGGQCVIMGLKGEDKNALKIINELKKLSQKDEYRDCLKVYDEREDQMGFFRSTDGTVHQNVKKGWLIRAASSAVMVPSHAEACGLVPMEAHCTGALVIAPYHQGLRDMCIPADWSEVTNQKSLTMKTGANAVCYANHENQNEARNSIKQAFGMIKTLDRNALNQYMKKTHERALTTYDWIVKDSEGNPLQGAALEYSKMYHEVMHKQEINPNVETFEQAYQRMKLSRRLDFISQKIQIIKANTNEQISSLVSQLLEETDSLDNDKIIGGLANLFEKTKKQTTENSTNDLHEIFTFLTTSDLSIEALNWHLQFFAVLGNSTKTDISKDLSKYLEYLKEEQNPTIAEKRNFQRNCFKQTIQEFAKEEGTSDDLTSAFLCLVGKDCKLHPSRSLEADLSSIFPEHSEFSKNSDYILKIKFFKRYNKLLLKL